MKNFIIAIIFLFGNEMLSQDLNNYKYVIVPDKYEFQKEANNYELNALTEFLFEKYGFVAFYQEKLPENMNGCDALTANVTNNSGFFSTKLILTLENCFGKVVFTSKEGESREKNLKRAYQEALRDAFSSVEALNYAYEAPKIQETPEKAPLAIKIVSKENNSAKVEPKQVPAEKNSSSETSEGEIFQNGNTDYLLKKTSSGFALFRYGEKGKFATLMKSTREGNYLYSSEKLNGNAFFDTSGNLIVEYIDPNTGQLVSLKYLQKVQ